MSMFTINENVKDGILEIQFSTQGRGDKKYEITCSKGSLLQKGKITGFTQRTCLYVGDLKRGTYHFKLDGAEIKSFSIA